MKKMIALLTLTVALSTGCAKVNPRLDEKIDNQNGRIDEIKNNQNGVMAEIGKLKQDADIQNSTLKDVQQGFVNLQSKLFSNENSGVQILQGDGPLILIFGLGTIAMLLWHYRSMAKRNEKTANILAQTIAKHGDISLEDHALTAAMHTDVEADVYKLIMKHKK